MKEPAENISGLCYFVIILLDSGLPLPTHIGGPSSPDCGNL